MSSNKLKVLVVDDTEQIRLLVMAYLNRLGYATVYSCDGEAAVKMFQQEQPDIILMDVMMPVMDGYEATREIRKLCGTRWLPIIFMSANVEIEDQVKGIEAGGDDYLHKPVNLRLLNAKIGAMQRIVEMQSEINKYHLEAQSEMALARKLVDNMTHNETLNDGSLRHWFQSAEKLSGDLIAAGRTRDNRLNVLVADATGHGLAAAMSQLPVSQCFYEMTRSGYSIPGMVAEMNTRLKSMLTTERYVAATVVSVDFTNQFVELWNGSGPVSYFVNSRGQILQEFPSTECALGIVDDDSYRLQTQVYQWDEPGELVVFSDGLLDAASADGELYGEERLAELFASDKDGSWFEKIQSEVEKFHDKKETFDDISLVSITCGEMMADVKVVRA